MAARQVVCNGLWGFSMSIASRSKASSLLACATTLALLSGATPGAAQEKATLPGTTCYEVTEAPGPVGFINDRGDVAYSGLRPGLIRAGTQNIEPFFPFSESDYNPRTILAGLAEDGTLAASRHFTTHSFPPVSFSRGFVKRPGQDPVEISIAGSSSVGIDTISADGTVGGTARFDRGGINNYDHRAFIAVRNQGSPNGYRITLFSNSMPSVTDRAVDVQGPLTLIEGQYPRVHDRRRSTFTPVVVPSYFPGQRGYFAPELLLRDGSAVIGSQFSYRWGGPMQQHVQTVIFRKDRDPVSDVESFRLSSFLPSLESAPFGFESRINAAAGDTLVGTMGSQIGYTDGNNNHGGRAIIYRVGDSFSRELSSLLCDRSSDVNLVEAVDITTTGQILVHGRDQRTGPGGYMSVYLLTPVTRTVELE